MNRERARYTFAVTVTFARRAMGTRDPRVDAYVAKSADFARPILEHLRGAVHEGCPDVEEAMKWSFPHFVYRGMLCSMASFKEHCAFGFWKGALVLEQDGRSAEAMGQFGRITKLADLPPRKVLVAYVKKAARLNDEGVKAPRPARPKRPASGIRVPADFAAALKKNKRAFSTFNAFSPSHKREYLTWVTEARGEDTRQRRLETAIAWMSEGKTRNWKYERK